MHDLHTAKRKARNRTTIVPPILVFIKRPGGERQSRTTVKPAAALQQTNEMCIHHSGGGGGVDPNAVGQASRSGLSHELAEMDSLPTQSVRPRLKRSPRRPATPQPLIWIVCAIWIAKRLADRLMHNSKEQGKRAAYLGVNSLYFLCNGVPLHPCTQPQWLRSDKAPGDRGNDPDRRYILPF